MRSADCIFCRLVSGEIPSRKVYEDEEVFAFHDIHPKAPVHFMIVPKLHLDSLLTAGPEHEALLGRILGLAPRLAKEQGCDNGFRVVINNGPDGGQEVYHLHIHIMGGSRPWNRQ